MDQPATGVIANEALERTFNSVVGKMKLIAIALDCAGCLRFCNQHFLTLTGWTQAEVTGCDYFDRFVPKELEYLIDVFAAGLRDSPETWLNENEILAKSGQRLLVRWNSSPIRSASGEVVGIASIGEDITERKKLEALLIDGQGRDRQQLSSEIHDGLGQSLYGASLLLEGLETFSRKTRSPIARDLAHLSSIIGESVTACRQIARGLEPLTDDRGGLAAALRNLVGIPTPSQTAVGVRIVGEIGSSLDARAADHLYRIAQEALANALRHAHARRIDIQLHIEPASVTLAVADDGIGIGEFQGWGGGLGLKLMRHRADIIHAKLTVARQPARGTLVLCVYPRQNSGSLH